MSSILVILLAIFLYGVVHSLLASLGAKGAARRWFGSLVDRWYRLAYNLFSTLTLIPVLALPVLLPDRSLYTIPFPWSAVFVGIQLIGLVVILVGLLQTGVWSFLGLSQLVGRSNRDQSDELVTKGLYRWMRHPLYTGGLLFIWFSPLMTRNLFALNLGLSLYLVIGAYFEERRLLRLFGEKYARYQRRVPMLVPLPWKHI